MENEARPSPLNAVFCGPRESVSEREDLTECGWTATRAS